MLKWRPPNDQKHFVWTECGISVSLSDIESSVDQQVSNQHGWFRLSWSTKASNFCCSALICVVAVIWTFDHRSRPNSTDELKQSNCPKKKLIHPPELLGNSLEHRSWRAYRSKEFYELVELVSLFGRSDRWIRTHSADGSRKGSQMNRCSESSRFKFFFIDFQFKMQIFSIYFCFDTSKGAFQQNALELNWL